MPPGDKQNCYSKFLKIPDDYETFDRIRPEEIFDGPEKEGKPEDFDNKIEIL